MEESDLYALSSQRHATASCSNVIRDTKPEVRKPDATTRPAPIEHQPTGGTSRDRNLRCAHTAVTQKSAPKQICLLEVLTVNKN